jgi:hypothetical protein
MCGAGIGLLARRKNSGECLANERSADDCSPKFLPVRAGPVLSTVEPADNIGGGAPGERYRPILELPTLLRLVSKARPFIIHEHAAVQMLVSVQAAAPTNPCDWWGGAAPR